MEENIENYEGTYFDLQRDIQDGVVDINGYD